MKKIAVIALAGAMLLGGCTGEYGTFDGSNQDQTNKGEVQTLTVTYKGKPLTCVRFNPDTKAESLSCDFVAYYQQSK